MSEQDVERLRPHALDERVDFVVGDFFGRPPRAAFRSRFLVNRDCAAERTDATPGPEIVEVRASWGGARRTVVAAESSAVGCTRAVDFYEEVVVGSALLDRCAQIV